MLVVGRLADKGRSMRFYCFAVAFVMAWMGCAGSIQHDENLAGKRAVEFAEIAFVKHDLQKGYALLSANTKRYVPFEKFEELVVKLHPRGGFPTSVAATEYEPMPGEKAIYIYLRGENSREHFDYIITMEGTASTDYRVLKLDRGSGLYSSGYKKKFTKSISIQP